ncbi:hypothetical protein Tco_0161682 [Tanacetum coccineum]
MGTRKPWNDTGVWTEPAPVVHCCKPFNYKSGYSEWPTCRWKEDGYCNGGNLPGAYIVGNTLCYQDLEWYEALKGSKLKEAALRNKAIMEGMIDDNDESSNNGWRRWDGYEIADHDQEEREYENKHEDEERCELFDDHELPVCIIRRFEMIKYSFRQDEEYVVIKEDEYEDLTNTSKEAIHAYQEIFRMMDEGWMDLAAKKSTKLEEEKAQKRGKVFNWETAKYGKIWYDEDVHDLRSVETEFPAIAFNDNLTSNERLSCEPAVSSLNNNEIDFRISFDESDDEDYTVVFDKNSFSYKIISANDLKMDLENDNEKVNMPSFPSPEPKVSYIDDLDFFKDFENEFPAIVYNDALTSKSDFSTEPTLCPQHIDKFDFKDETSFSEYDEEEQNILYFNDQFPFNIIYPDDLKSDKDNDDNKIDMIQSWGGGGILVSKNGYGVLVEGYTEEIVHDFEQGLGTIFKRQVNRVHILDFEGLTLDMRQDLAERLRIVYTKDDGKEVFVSHA